LEFTSLFAPTLKVNVGCREMKNKRTILFIALVAVMCVAMLAIKPLKIAYHRHQMGRILLAYCESRDRIAHRSTFDSHRDALLDLEDFSHWQHQLSSAFSSNHLEVMWNNMYTNTITDHLVFDAQWKPSKSGSGGIVNVWSSDQDRPSITEAIALADKTSEEATNKGLDGTSQ
jgi:hypothetical protein